ncbi:hypothetical protein, partial [Lentibacillus sp.]|uniref:hypothetical protein n=1 Tax=Lentibacillus sp. TaxID=1925746 RepID=UPI002B4AFAE6
SLTGMKMVLILLSMGLPISSHLSLFFNLNTTSTNLKKILLIRLNSPILEDQRKAILYFVMNYTILLSFNS